MPKHFMWWSLSVACIVWYIALTWYVTIRGYKDIKDMLTNIKNKKDTIT